MLHALCYIMSTMKIPKEYTLLIILGLFLLAYALESVAHPLSVKLESPYAFLQPKYLTIYPFTATTIGIRSIALFVTPLWLLGFIKRAYYAKGGVLLILAALMQLYGIQEVASGTRVVPLEWSLSLSIGGAALLVPAVVFIAAGAFSAVAPKLSGAPTKSPSEPLEE